MRRARRAMTACEHLGTGSRVGAGRVLGRELHVVGERARAGARRRRRAQAPRRVILRSFHVEVDPRWRGRCGCGGCSALERAAPRARCPSPGARERAVTGRALTASRDRAATRLEVAGRGDREAGLDDVDARGGRAGGPSDLLRGGSGCSPAPARRRGGWCRRSRLTSLGHRRRRIRIPRVGDSYRVQERHHRAQLRADLLDRAGRARLALGIELRAARSRSRRSSPSRTCRLDLVEDPLASRARLVA